MRKEQNSIIDKDRESSRIKLNQFKNDIKNSIKSKRDEIYRKK